MPATIPHDAVASALTLTPHIRAVREELEFAVDPAYTVREARGGRHVAVTLEPMLPSARRVLAVYRRLGALEGLVLLW